MSDLAARRERAFEMYDQLLREFFGAPADPGFYAPGSAPCGGVSIHFVDPYPMADPLRWQWSWGPAAALVERGICARSITSHQARHGYFPRDSIVVGVTGVPIRAHPSSRVIRYCFDHFDAFTAAHLQKLPWLTPEQTVEYGRGWMRADLVGADCIVVGSEPLVDVVHEINPDVPVSLVPWAAPKVSEWPGPPSPPSGWAWRRRIGWAGGPGAREPDFAVLREPFTRLARRRPDLEFIFWGDAAPPWSDALPHRVTLPFQRLPASGPSGFHQALANLRLDAAVGPLAQTGVNHSRSRAKFIDSTVAWTPLVASDFGPYRRLAEAGAPLITVDDSPEAWYEALVGLLNNDVRRTELVEAARQWVAKYATIDVVADDWMKAIHAAANAS